MRLLTKLLCAILFTVVLGTATAAYVVYRDAAATINNTSMEFARLAVVELSLNLDLLINGLKHNTAILGDTMLHLRASPQSAVSGDIQQEFERRAQLHNEEPREERNAALFDPQGNMLLKTQSLPPDIAYSANEAFAAALRGASTVSRPLFSEQEGKFVLFAAVPVVRHGEILGVAIGVMDFAPIASKVLAVRLGAHGYCFVVDGHNNIVAHPGLATAVRARLGEGQKQFVFRQHDEWSHYTWDNVDKQAHVSKLTSVDWRVVASLSTEDLKTQAAAISNHSLMVNVSLLAVISLILFFIVRSITGSLARGVRFAKALSEGDFSHTLDADVRRADELGELAAALRHMQHNLRANLENLRREKENAEEARQALNRHKESLAETVHTRTRELHLAELKLRLLLDAVPDAILGLNQEGRVEFVNQAAVTMLGVEAGERLPENMHAAGWNAKRPEGGSPVLEACARREQAHFPGSTVWRKDGSRLPADVSIHPIRREDPHSASVLLVRDLSARRELEEEVQALYRTSADSYLIWDMQGQCLKISDDALRLFGAATRRHFTQDWNAFVLPGTAEDPTPD
ncbi:MAG: PAS domain S-box protein, partial [Deltaproteobacteria bacterium]|nr:PAS domain S-box protein [Deltaproteobacteria bacterium]